MPLDPYFSSKTKVKAQPPPKPAPSLAEGVTPMKQKAATR